MWGDLRIGVFTPVTFIGTSHLCNTVRDPAHHRELRSSMNTARSFFDSKIRSDGPPLEGIQTGSDTLRVVVLKGEVTKALLVLRT